MTRSLSAWTPRARSSPSGGSGSFKNDCSAWRSVPGAGGQPDFPPQVVIEVKALACELPSVHGIPLSRFSMEELKREILARGLVATIGQSTLWRWLSQDAIRPWYHRSWIFPRDPAFAEKAARVLDLYEGYWEGAPLGPADSVLCADEKTSIQARRRLHVSLAPAPGRAMRVESEYDRMGALAYLAVWDVRRAKVLGRCESKTGIAAFDRLVHQVMSQEPYDSASRVFWVVDNSSSHRGQRCVERLQRRWPNLIVVHTPIHASWLNQIEIYFSIVQRKVLTPNDFASLEDLEQRLLAFQGHYEQVARPFQWKFTRRDLEQLLQRLQTHDSIILDKAA